MYIRTIEQKVFTFKDLKTNEELKQKVLEKLHDLNVDHEWSKFIKDEVKELGLKIVEFDISARNYIECEIIYPNTTAHWKIAKAIVKNHGKECDTYKTAKEFLTNRPKFGQDVENLETEFLRAISEDYLSLLRNEYEWRTSEEQILESIESNEYEFDSAGNIT